MGFCAAASILLCGVVSTLGQTPGQGPAPPPIHIPHIGGSKQERPQPEVSAEGQVYIVLWFDTEDYILPQSDDAAKRIAVFLTQQGIPATFKVVGEKARVLQQRQRQDVISAIAQHEIGYHSNTHSQHPTVAEYESNLDWDTGVEEFTRRERPGFDDVAHIFRKTPVAYGQPGVFLGAASFSGAAKMGRARLSGRRQAGGIARPALLLRRLAQHLQHSGGRSNCALTQTWSNLDTAKARFQDAYLAMSSRKAGGVISAMLPSLRICTQGVLGCGEFPRWSQPAAGPVGTPAG